MRGVYRHSVWIDVFGVLLLLGLLLAPLGYLITEIEGGGLGAGSTIASERGGGPRRPADRRAVRGPVGNYGPSTRADRSLGRIPSSMPEVPFSDGWQAQATPELTGPSDAGGPSFGGSVSDGGSTTEGPVIASRSPSGAGGKMQRGGRSTGGGWRAEARQLSRQARSLAGQLRQLDRSGQRDNRSGAPPEQPSAKASAAGGKATTSNNPGTPSDPSQVPIGDHLHWLAVAGLLWGVWRLGRGG